MRIGVWGSEGLGVDVGEGIDGFGGRFMVVIVDVVGVTLVLFFFCFFFEC